MPAFPSWLIDPIWNQCQVLLPVIVDHHPLGCHRPRIPDRVIFDKLVQILVFGHAYGRIADATQASRPRPSAVAATPGWPLA